MVEDKMIVVSLACTLTYRIELVVVLRSSFLSMVLALFSYFLCFCASVKH